jgi:hypothetical protein
VALEPGSSILCGSFPIIRKNEISPANNENFQKNQASFLTSIKQRSSSMGKDITGLSRSSIEISSYIQAKTMQKNSSYELNQFRVERIDAILAQKPK